MRKSASAGIIALALLAITAIWFWYSSSRGPLPPEKPLAATTSGPVSGTAEPAPPLAEVSSPKTAVGESAPNLPPAVSPEISDPFRATKLTTSGPVGEVTRALISYAGRSATVTPNESGEFPEIYIEPKAKVPVELSFPEGAPGDPVGVRVEDGGALDEQRAAGKAFALGEEKKVNFEFTANASPGAYSVLVTHRGVERALRFWVGPELPIRR